AALRAAFRRRGERSRRPSAAGLAELPRRPHKESVPWPTYPPFPPRLFIGARSFRVPATEPGDYHARPCLLSTTFLFHFSQVRTGPPAPLTSREAPASVAPAAPTPDNPLHPGQASRNPA